MQYWDKLRPSGPLLSYVNFNFDVNFLVYEQNILGFPSEFFENLRVPWDNFVKFSQS